MGAWGPALFSDDTAVDVRESYKARLADGLNGPSATDALLEEWKESIADEDEGPVFWLSLAATQHRLGRLEDRVFEHAFEVLDRRLGLGRWSEDERLLRQRHQVLEKLRTELLAPQPAPSGFRHASSIPARGRSAS